MTPNTPRLPRTLLLAATVAALVAPSVTARGVGEIVGLTPDRIERFRVTLQDFLSSRTPAPDVLALESAWSTPLLSEIESDRIVVPLGGRDLVFEEQFLVSGREDEHADAARRWVERSLKGSSNEPVPVAEQARARRAGLSPRLGWDHGPTAGFRAGPVKATVGEGAWRVRYDRMLRRSSGSPWRASAWVGEEDGEHEAGFLIGRTLLAATR